MRGWHDERVPPVPTPADRPAPPQHCPSQRELDDLDLLLSGALDPAAGFNESGSAVTLDLPADVAAQAAGAGAVELVDPEGLPLARAPWPSGPVEPLATPEHGPFRRLHLSPAQARERHAGRTLVPVRGPLTDDDLRALRGRGPLLLLALTGAGTAVPSAPALLRATLAAAQLLPDAEVVAAPLARRAAEHEDGQDELVRRVLEAYGAPADAPVLGADERGVAADTLPPEIAAAVGGEREPGVVLFFTGLSGSGKSTLARALMDRVLEQSPRTVTSLDGDVVRRHLSKGLTFSKEDRETNILRIGWVAAEIARHGGLAVCSPIAPFDETRRRVRAMVEEAGGRFFLVHVATPLEECERRDRKGLYAKARAGEIPEFTGISSPYEEPEDAAVVVDTTARTIEDALGDVVAGLGSLVPELAAPGGRVAAEERGGVSRPFRILFVCTANICRSPYMEAVARERLAAREVEVASAGVHGLDARPADEVMARQLHARGIEAPGFRSRAVTPRMIADADVVLTAEAAHRSLLLEEHPAQLRKIFTLGQLAGYLRDHEPAASGRDLVAEAGRARGSASPDLDVADPYRRGDAAAAAAARHIDELLDVVLPALVPEED